MLSATTWVPRGFASEFPEKYELDDQEMERITKLAQLEINDAQKNIKAIETGEDDDTEEQNDDEDREENNSKSSALGSQFENDDDLKEYDLEHYDDDVETVPGSGERISMFPGLSNEIDAEFHDGGEEEEGDGNDPYITLPNEEDALQEKQDFQVYPTDNMILAARTEDEVSYLDVYVYDDGAGAPEGAEDEEEDKLDPDVAKGLVRGSSLYIHHDLMLPAFPLCVEWVNYKPGSIADDSNQNVGNFAAIGTFDPQIEIWNLDSVDKAFPDLILGEPSSNSLQGLRKKNKKKSKHITTHHTDAVLSLSHNKQHRNILASTSADHTVKLWDLATGDAARSFNQIHSSKNVSSSQWHLDNGAILLTGGYDGRAAVSDVRISDSSELSKYYKLNIVQDIESVRWISNEQFLAGTDQGNVYCYDIRNESKPLWTLQAHDAGISSLEINNFLPELLVTSAMGEKSVKLWKLPKVSDGEVRGGPSMVLSRDFGVGNVLTSSFAPDIEVSGNIVIGGVNKGLKLFDVFSNRSVRNSFKDSLRDLQKRARGEAKEQGKASRIARKYQGEYSESVVEAESDGDEEEDDDEEEEDDEGME
ncbi:hypothetical protein WICMUC_004609 [Wickerhamomyces mucosus]|uniref:Periodic tryptophan protein 1 n=1 Tax=Wickerhamomyces mucosus TaxID=1378264 RepID=A0A9P8PHN5_9ASCO|nr:hypothetical protein WICMUC_004609 [Wickerhamomyces mucosus]